MRLQDGAVFEHRADSANIQFYLNTSVAPGLKNADGQAWITADANIPEAVSAAIHAWNSVASANVHFAPVQPTGSLDGTPDLNVIAFDDTPENRELIGTATAVTVRILALPDVTGAFLKTDIIFNPTYVFSTNLAAGTYDLQAVLTHELGHTLGADHSGVLSATMFQQTHEQVNNEASLSPDDIAFVTEAYPRSGAFGVISGTTTDQNGHVLRGALVTAQDPVSGTIVGGFSSPGDGSFSFIAPPGSYQLWAEPLTGLVQPPDLYLTSPVDTQFQPALASSLTQVSAGATSQVLVEATAGASPIAFQFAGAVPPHTAQFNIYSGPGIVASGADVPFVIQVTGLGSDFSDANVTIAGPATLVPGSIVWLGGSQYELTLHVPATTTATSASILIDYHGNTAAFSGGLIIQPAAPSFSAAGVGNVFSYASQAVAPGEIVAIFGANLGPATGVGGSFDANGSLGANLAGVQVTFNGQPAPILYASAGQVNVEVPYETAGSASAAMVISNGGAASGAVNVTVAPSVPGLLPSALNPDGSFNSASNAVTRGQYLILYAVGLGLKTSAVQTGQEVVGAEPSAAPVTVTINGQPYTPEYAGAAPYFTGLDQINVAIPASVAPGKGSLTIEINGQTSQPIPIWVR